MKPKRTHTRSSPSGRAKIVSAPRAVAWSSATATSCAAISSGSSRSTTTGPCSSVARPSDSPTTAPTRRSAVSPPPAKAPHASATRPCAGHGTAVNSKRARAADGSGRGRYPVPCHTRGVVALVSEGAGASPTPVDAVSATGGGARRPADRRPPGLLLPKHRVLEALGETELAHPLGGNLDWFPGLRVAPDPGLAIGEDQLPEAWQHEPVLRFLLRELQRRFEDLPDLLLRQTRLLSEVGHGCRLRHHLRHGRPPVGTVELSAT